MTNFRILSRLQEWSTSCVVLSSSSLSVFVVANVAEREGLGPEEVTRPYRPKLRHSNSQYENYLRLDFLTVTCLYRLPQW